MAKNPKIEFFIININSSKKEKPTFRDLFTELYSIKKSKNTRDNINNSILMNTFLQYVFDKISGKYKVDNQKKKAFYIEKEKKKLGKNIKFLSEKYIIHGLIKGGEYDTGKEEGDLKNPDKKSKLAKTSVLLDDFYFLLYTPLDKSKGILILQNYTSDQISDVFLPFIRDLFKIDKLSLKATLEPFMPIEMQKEIKKNGIIEKFTFSNEYLIDDLDKDTHLSEGFVIEVNIFSKSKSINPLSLSFWRKKIRDFKITTSKGEVRSLDTFNKQYGYIRERGSTLSTPTRFVLDDDSIKIKPTIFLQNYIRLEENYTPIWKELEDFALKTLKEIVIPEVYPEDFIDED